ncbi:MAG: class I SAM-dependent methyltransferase [Phycisphaera sp.]|nr:class I SAM-dependent methyltransferase [Phycisphaera sp.]
MFSKSQDWYDLVYDAQGKDYLEEARRLRLVFEGHGISTEILGRRPSWLDVACGTGRHLLHLPEFDRLGIDLDPGMLDVARKRCPCVAFQVGDMRSLHRSGSSSLPAARPDGRFDVVTCLFSAIAYMRDLGELELAIASMADRVADGGLLLVEPFLTPEVVVEGRPGLNIVDRDDVKLVRMDVPRVDGRRLELEFHYLVADASGVEHRVEPHVVTTFTVAEIGAAIAKTGLDWRFESGGGWPRGLHLGTKPRDGV